MDSLDYQIAWGLYLLAATGLSILSWYFFKRFILRELAYLLECWLLAILLTPAKVMVDANIMAPALVVFVMDTLTIDLTTGIRGLIPLVMSLLAMSFVAMVLCILYRLKIRKKFA